VQTPRHIWELKTEGRTGRENTSMHSEAAVGAGGEGACRIRVFTG
jgi:hypothetical protein